MAAAKVQTQKAKTTTKKKKKKTAPTKVLVRINASYNNTLVTVTDYNGNTISASSCGAIGFKGSKKSTAYAATKAGEDASAKALELGAQEAEVIVKGIGIGRQAAVKGVRSAGLKITSLADFTPIPHGGCKPRRAPKN
ncbi:30S ribosomal protein S11 [Candidatus Dojkabacteria bacterium]|uniref:Small ribosomal subunit protein uS11 n=1 Tax=Candidatus Dojkabacteria bacterium TaxID=2099670 RepID=A0A955I8I1_9BACT|nr:30S ribosomal protein S11 [Candidatus Dojkabacteria bacterium]